MIRELLGSLIVESPLGELLLVGGADGVAAVAFLDDVSPDDRRREISSQLDATVVADEHPVLHRARRQLVSWFAGKRRGFTLPLDLHGTPFQTRVWEALQRVPFGETCSYGELASGIGHPRASRAVAGAAARNPLALLVPCHRLVGADGVLGGYAGGLWRKQRLLALERGHTDDLPLFHVAALREEDAARHRAHARTLEALSAELREPLEARAAGEPSSALAQSRWLERAVASVAPPELAVLADLVAERATTSGDGVLRGWADDLIGLATAHLSDHVPSPTEARCILHAAVAVGSHWYELVARRLVGLDRLSAALRAELEAFFEEIMDGSVRAAPFLRERTVDLWLGLRERVGDDHWTADRSADRSAALVRLGLYREAALAGEADLAACEGDRRVLLERLVDVYERLGDVASARDKVLCLLAERRDPFWIRRLRELDDTPD